MILLLFLVFYGDYVVAGVTVFVVVFVVVGVMMLIERMNGRRPARDAVVEGWRWWSRRSPGIVRMLLLLLLRHHRGGRVKWQFLRRRWIRVAPGSGGYRLTTAAIVVVVVVVAPLLLMRMLRLFLFCFRFLVVASRLGVRTTGSTTICWFVPGRIIAQKGKRDEIAELAATRRRCRQLQRVVVIRVKRSLVVVSFVVNVDLVFHLVRFAGCAPIVY